jgi:hypothetical protein
MFSFNNADGSEGENLLLLTQGEILVLPNQDSTKWMTVLNSDGSIARIKGCAMVVSADPSAKEFKMGCLGGTCEFGLNVDHLSPMDVEKSLVIKNGSIGSPEDIDLAGLQKIFDQQIPECPAIPVTGIEETPAPAQVDVGATATASCRDFKSRFPGTPCP